MLKVKNMKSENGNMVVNQFIIEGDGKTVFQSYNSMIVTILHNEKRIVIGKDYNYSRTTAKYRNLFFNRMNCPKLASLKGLQESIKNGSVFGFKVEMEETGEK